MPVDRLSRFGRVAWVLAATAVTGLFAVSTAIGDDSWFPAAPMRMFATANNPDTAVEIYRVEGVNEKGVRMLMSQDKTGLRWAEIEGQTNEMAEDPEKARFIADSYHARNPDKYEIVAIEVIFAFYDLENGSLTGECHEEVMASWYADGHPVPEPSDGSLSPLSCSRGVVSEWD